MADRNDRPYLARRGFQNRDPGDEWDDEGPQRRQYDYRQGDRGDRRQLDDAQDRRREHDREDRQGYHGNDHQRRDNLVRGFGGVRRGFPDRDRDAGRLGGQDFRRDDQRVGGGNFGRAGGGGRGRGRAGGEGDRRGNKLELSVRFLQKLKDREPSDILLTLTNPNTKTREALKNSENNSKLLTMLLRVLAIAFKCNSADEHFMRLNLIMKESSFLDTAANFFLEMQSEESVQSQEDFHQTILDLIEIMSEMAVKNPSCMTELLGVYTIVEMTIDSMRQTSDIIDEEVLGKFREFTQQRNKLMKKTHRKQRAPEADHAGQEHFGDPPDNFRDIEVFPQTTDMQGTADTYLRKNKVKGRYTDLEHYLDVQFRLLREDFIAPLREGISQYVQAVTERGRRTKRIHEVRIYHSVRIISPSCSETGLCHLLQFDVSRFGHVRWKSNKRLIYGSLICLSPDNFRTFYFATVANRDEKYLQQGIIEVHFEHDQETVKNISGMLFTMAETTAYFESYRHVLSGLQKVRQGDLPFEKYIIDCDSDVKPPAYLNRNSKLDLRPLVDENIKIKIDSQLEQIGEVVRARRDTNFSEQSKSAKDVTVLDRKTWPPADLLHLDESQFKALHTALTKEFVITQGPPGTGKTYIGLKIVKALLHNIEAWSFNPLTLQKDMRPMLIVCYTNHALDQFLEGLLKFFEGDLVRVGGRSNSEVLRPYNLHNFRQRFRHAQKVPVQVFQSRREAKSEMDSLSGEINKNTAKIRIATTNILHEDYLQPFIGQYHYRILQDQFFMLLQVYPHAEQVFRQNNSIIVEWLELGNLAPIVQMEGNMEPEFGAQVLLQGEEGDDDDGLIDVDDELDALIAQRDLDDHEEDEEEDDDGINMILENLLTRKQKNNIKVQRAENEQWKAVALDVNKITEEENGTDNMEWKTQRKERNKMKKTLQKNLSSAEIMGDEEAKGVRDLWRMSKENKWRLYRLWVRKYCDHFLNDIEEKQEEFAKASERYREALMQEDKEIMKHSTVIGMTTTGAARYQAVLQELKPRIIVVEEAAEVLEAHIITTLSKGCEQLILIGDHKQLKPNPTVYKLATEYNLDVSLFERMIKNGIHCDCLELQHRMRPEIAELMHHIYENLRDHDDVKAYADIKGVSNNMYFITHNHAESNDEDLRSHSNQHEARYLVGLCEYLLLQGYKPEQITVLTLYSGQLFCLRKMMPKDKFEGVRVTVVDNYQGEENDIILLSLVRSNEDGNIGFLKIENRVCVALSRAKMGFFVIGNFDLLSSKSKLWKEITFDMKEKKLLSESLELYCQNHPDSDRIMASDANDFKKAPEGGCSKKCNARLNCGHTCEMFCHVQDPDHAKYFCRKKCSKTICENGHRCRKRCHEDCGNCMESVPKSIPRCGHIQQVPCSMAPEKYSCRADCEHILKCGHKCQTFCGKAHTSNCKIEIEKEWPCGHKGNVLCHERDTAYCPKPCNMPLACDHLCPGTCGKCLQGRLHQPCTYECKRILICGHECDDMCNLCPPCKRKCENKCPHSKCSKKCGEPCAPCMEPCKWRCEHYKCSKLCSEPCDRPRCDKPCKKRLPCSHFCIGLCGEPCPTDCRICDKEKVSELLFGDEDEPNARFVLLVDCRSRCIIEANAMDYYMDQRDELNEIQLKACPKCKTTIRSCVRYGSIINKQLQDIESVKKTVISNKERTRKLEEDIKDSLQDEKIDEDDRYEIRRQLRQLVDPKSENKLTALLNQLSVLRSVSSLEQDWSLLKGIAFKNERGLGLINIQVLRDWALLERTNMTPQETSDVELEVSRSKAHITILLLQQKAKEIRKIFDPMMKTKIFEAERLLQSKTKYDERTRIIVEQCISDLKDIVPMDGLGISDEERIKIVEAMKLPKGHWFKCPKGHIYAIGDCGGATVESRCPECGSAIGGGSHRLRSDNQFAGEMDGAAHPAWSELANIENFGFNIVH